MPNNLHLFFFGDKKLALRYVKWAKDKLRDLRRTHPGFDGNSFGVQRFYFGGANASVRVLIKMVNEQKWIIVWAEGGPALYMESGVLDFLNIAPLNENTYLPAQLHYNTDIDDIRGPGAALGKLRVQELSPGKLDGENRDEGESKALGCKEKEEEITVSSGTISRTFSAATETYCPDLYLFKNVQDTLPASMFSGKLRLLVQAIYGSKRRDYYVDPTIPSTTPLYLEHDGFTPWFSNNSGLFSGRDYQYFRIRLSPNMQGGGIFAKKLTPSSAGKKLRRYLINNPSIPAERKLRYEAYLLSTLRYEDDAENVKIGELGDLFSHGSPFGYGCAWNWEGDTAYVATHDRKEGTTNVWQATLHRIVVKEADLADTLEEGRLSAKTYVEEGPTDFTFRVNQDLIWEPDHLNSGMKLFVTQEDAHDVPTHVEADVPIKVVANYKNDSFDVVRFKREDLDSTMGGFDANQSDSNDVVGRTGCGDEGCDLWASATGAIKVGFYIENITGNTYEFFEAVGKDGDSVDFNAADVYRLGDESIGFWNTSGSATADCGELPDGADNSEQHFIEARGGRLSGNGDFDRQGMLIVPYYDCDAVYLGTAGNFDGSVNSAHVDDGRAAGLEFFFDSDGNQLGDGSRIPITWANTDPTGPADPESVAWWGGCSTGSQDCNIEQESGSSEIGDIRVEHFFNGEFTETHANNYVTNPDLVDAMYIPSCLASIPFDDDVGQGWEEGSADYGGYSLLFNPIVFPEPSVGTPVLSKSTANFYSFRATKNPGGSDDTIHDGSYDFDNISDDADNFQFSFVGFA